MVIVNEYFCENPDQNSISDPKLKKKFQSLNVRTIFCLNTGFEIFRSLLFLRPEMVSELTQHAYGIWAYKYGFQLSTLDQIINLSPSHLSTKKISNT